jgi:ABC-type bacteriocin/lantibiotic exporter with double-glycine peptidase domain
MGRKKILPIKQPDETTCGPTAIKTALQILGKKHSFDSIKGLCKTNRNGTTFTNMICALNKLGYHVLAVQYATLHHIQSALKYTPSNIRAVMVNYLYRIENNKPKPTSGHYATVSSYSASKSRIYVFDSYSGRKVSYSWVDFRNRWKDYDLKRRKSQNKQGDYTYKLIKRWQNQLMLVITATKKELPKFKIDTATYYSPN